MLIIYQNLPNVKNHRPAAYGVQSSSPSPPVLSATPTCSPALIKHRRSIQKGPHRTNQKQTASSMSPAPNPVWSEGNQARSPQGAVCPSSLRYRQIHKCQQIEQPTVFTFPQQSHFPVSPTLRPHSILGLEKVVPPSSWTPHPAQSPEPEASPEGMLPLTWNN